MRMAVAAQAALLLCIAFTRGTPIGSDRSTVARARLHSHSIHNPAAADTTSSLFNSSRSWVKSLFPLSTLWGTALGTGAAEGTLALPGNRSSPPTLFVVEDVSETALGTPEEEGVVGHNLPQIDAASGVQAGGLIPNHGMASQVPRLTVVDAQHVVESRANLTELSEEGAHAAAEAVPEDPSKALELPVARGSKNPVALLEPLHSPPKASSSVAAGNAAAPPGAAITASMSVDYASLPPVLDTFFSGTCATQRMKAGISMRDGVWLSKRLKAVYVPNLKAGMLAIIQYLHAYGPTKKLERVTPETVINLVSSGYKFFTFVRDPLSRMRSAYSETLYHTLKKTGRNHARFMVQMAPGKAQFEEFARSLKCCRKTFVKEIYHADPQSVFIGSGVSFRVAPPPVLLCFSIYDCLSVCLPVCLSVCLSVRPPVCHSMHLATHLCLSVCSRLPPFHSHTRAR